MPRTLDHSRRNSNNVLSWLGENRIFNYGAILRRGLLVSRKPITLGSVVTRKRMVSGRKFGPPTCGLRWLHSLGLYIRDEFLLDKITRNRESCVLLSVLFAIRKRNPRITFWTVAPLWNPFGTEGPWISDEVIDEEEWQEPEKIVLLIWWKTLSWVCH